MYKTENPELIMEAEIIINNNDFSMWFYPEGKIIHHKFHKFVCGNKLREYLNLGIKTMKEKGAEKWLSDDRENATLSPEDALYGKETWGPAARAAGWKYWALIMPEAFTGKSSMQEFLDYNMTNGITIKLFSDPDSAIKWLNEI